MLELLKERFLGYEIVELDEDYFEIVNPFGKGNIGVYEDKTYTIVIGEEWRKTPPSNISYIVSFYENHRRFKKKEAALAYIKSIMNGEICAVEFLKHEILRMGGEIASSKVAGLTLETLLHSFSFDLADTEFTVRSFSGKHDMNGRIEEANGKLTLILE